MKFLCPFVFYLLAVCPNPCNPTLPTFRSEETQFLWSDRHPPFVKLNVISTRVGSFHCTAR